MSDTISKQFLLATPMAYGHIRLEVGFACDTVLAEPTLLFTIFVVKYAVPIVIREVETKLHCPDAVSRVRVIGVGDGGKPDAASTTPDDLLTVPIRESYQDLFERQTVTCKQTGKIYDYRLFPLPSAVFIDFFSYGVLDVITSQRYGMKIIHIFPSTANVTLIGVGPEKYGGWLDVEDRARDLADMGDPRALPDIVNGLLAKRKFALLPNAEGLGMYEYERWPHDMIPGQSVQPRQTYNRGPWKDTLSTPKGNITGPGATKAAVYAADAAIVFTIPIFEPSSAEALRSWYVDDLGKQLFFVGPPRPETHNQVASSLECLDPCITFLEKHPARTVILISFGTVYYPTRKWQIDTLIETLLGTQTPFVISKASSMYQPLDPALEDIVADSGLGLIVDYLPQREALNHPSVSAFVTHGGANSMFESIYAGVPCIFWPFTADQPMHAAYLSQKVDCAWELIQTRVGEGARAPFRGGKVEGTPAALREEIIQVLSELHGQSGEKKRKNLEITQKKLLESLSKGGIIDIALKDLIEYSSKP